MNSKGPEMSKAYTFGILRYRPSLMEPNEAKPVAVVASGEEGVVAIGTHLVYMDGVSGLGEAILKELPSLVAEQIEKAVHSDERDVFEHLGAAHEWNLFLSDTAVVHREDELPLVAFQLFLDHVLGAYLDEEQLTVPLERYGKPQDNIFFRQARQPSSRRAVRA